MRNIVLERLLADLRASRVNDRYRNRSEGRREAGQRGKRDPPGNVPPTVALLYHCIDISGSLKTNSLKSGQIDSCRCHITDILQRTLGDFLSLRTSQVSIGNNLTNYNKRIAIMFSLLQGTMERRKKLHEARKPLLRQPAPPTVSITIAHELQFSYLIQLPVPWRHW